MNIDTLRLIDRSLYCTDDNGFPYQLTPTDITTYAAEIKAFEDGRQSAKPAELKVIENTFLMLCEQLTGTREKRSFSYLGAILEPMILSDDPVVARQGDILFKKLTALNQNGVYFDAKWWDSCVWHD